MLHSYNFSYNAILRANPLAHPKAAWYFKSSPYESSIACLEHTTAKIETRSPLLDQLCPVTRSSYASLLLKTKFGRNTASSTHSGALDPFCSFGVTSNAVYLRPRTESRAPSPCSAITLHFILSVPWPSIILRLIFFFFCILLVTLPEPPCSSNETSVRVFTSNWWWFLSQYHPFAYLAFIESYS